MLLVSPGGKTIALDPFDVVNPLEADLAVFTHSIHADLRTAPNVHAPRLEYKVESRTVGDVKITGIPASHRGGAIDPVKPDHVIYRVEVDGFVIALLGCLGQEQLTPEQLAALGPVDVALLTADDGGFERLQLVEGAYRLVKQLRPRAVVPLSHHNDDEEALPRLGELGRLETAPALTLTRESLAAGAIRIVHLVP
jgi:L-ascorbate metabolism protein UlaG (beta-lactamase superfamily)